MNWFLIPLQYYDAKKIAEVSLDLKQSLRVRNIFLMTLNKDLKEHWLLNRGGGVTLSYMGRLLAVGSTRTSLKFTRLIKTFRDIEFCLFTV